MTFAATHSAGDWNRVASWRRAILAVAVLGCVQGACTKPLTPAEQARWTRDSAQYVRDSTKFVRDTFVRDSISRTVATDSLYHLYRAMLHAPDPVPLLQETYCEGYRLDVRYGAWPAEAAMARMEDTLWKAGEHAAVVQMWAKIENMPVERMASLGISDRRCHAGPAGPDTVSGTVVDGGPVVPPGRPRRP